jgi:hypothetical protein
MNFEVKISGNEVWILRSAGVEMYKYQNLYFESFIHKRTQLPASVTCPYFLSDEPVSVEITILGRGHLRIKVADAAIGKKIQSEVLRYASGNRSNAIADAEHKALYVKIDKILKPDGVNSRDVEANQVTLSRRAQEQLMKLCEEIHHIERGNIYWQFTKCQIPKQDRAFVTGWLLKRFAIEKDPTVRSDIDTVFLNHGDLVLREFADEVIRLLKDSRYGVSRSGLVHYLTKIKHPRAAELIVSVMDDDRMAWSSLRSLGILKAKQHATHVRKYLRDPDSEIRREARRALKKMGVIMDQAPAPIHLVKNRKSLPKGLEEWSANLDFENLEPVLKSLAECVDKGFGAQEIAEVLGVAEETRPDQTKAFRFPITTGQRSGEVWVVIFMDDIDAPDLAIHADPALIKKLEGTVDLKD